MIIEFLNKEFGSLLLQLYPQRYWSSGTMGNRKTGLFWKVADEARDFKTQEKR